MKNNSIVPTALPAAAERFALRVAARLSGGTDDYLPYDITERLRAARMQALARRKVTAPARCRAPVTGLAEAGAAAGLVQAGGSAAGLVQAGSSAAWGGAGGGGRWWHALVSAVSLLALVVGLVCINTVQDERSTHDVAEVDAALLTDDLPPAAYADPGFVQFLKTSALSD